MTTATSKETLGKALGRIASGIYILTAGTGSEKHGMLASWVMQSSFDPPRLTVCVQRDRDILKTIRSTRKFVLNVLSESNSTLMGRFGKYRPDQFDDLDLTENGHGVILNDSVAFLCCEFKEEWDGGDHLVLLAEVVEGDMLNPDLQPWTHLRKNGLSY